MNKNETHGMSRTRIYKVWTGMLNRCRNPKDSRYDQYGGRGVTVCEEWYKFENFYKDMGKCPKGYHLDRMDNTRGYSPDNCRWVSVKQSCRNKRNTRLIAYKGKIKPISEWEEIFNFPRNLLTGRIINLGWPIKKAIETPYPQSGRNQYSDPI